jgi:hypothetical protein
MDGFDCGVLEIVGEDRDLRAVEREHIDLFIKDHGRKQLLNSTLNTICPLDDPEVRAVQRKAAADYFVNNPEKRKQASEHAKSLLALMETSEEYADFRENRAKRMVERNSDPEYSANRVSALIAAMGKKVECVDTGEAFNSGSEAAKYVRETFGKPKAHQSAISACCTGKIKSAYKLKWRYI